MKNGLRDWSPTFVNSSLLQFYMTYSLMFLGKRLSYFNKPKLIISYCCTRLCGWLIWKRLQARSWYHITEETWNNDWSVWAPWKPKGVKTKFSDEVSWVVPRSKLGCDASISRVIACVILIWAREGLPNEFYGTGWLSLGVFSSFNTE